MVTIPRPSFNVDTLEGAVQHMLMVCGPLSDAALDSFAQSYAYERGKKLPPNYASQALIPRLKRERKIYQSGKHLFTLNPMLRQNQKGLDAFWVFLEHMDGVDIETVIKPPKGFGQIAYIKNNRIYFIIRCDGNGATELSAAAQKEIYSEQRRKRHPNEAVDVRYFFIFNSEADMNAAPFALKSPTLFGSIKYEGTLTPSLFFVDPASKVGPSQPVMHGGGT